MRCAAVLHVIHKGEIADILEVVVDCAVGPAASKQVYYTMGARGSCSSRALSPASRFLAAYIVMNRPCDRTCVCAGLVLSYCPAGMIVCPDHGALDRSE